MEEIKETIVDESLEEKQFNKKLIINLFIYLMCIIIYLVMFLIPKKIIFSTFNLHLVYNIIMIKNVLIQLL